MIKKSNFVKANDKSIVRSTHPPLKTVVITCQDQKTEVNATPFKIADNQTPIISIIEQNNFTNESLHVIGQQLDRIEEKIVERTVSIEKPASEKSVFVKTEKPLIDLPNQREKVMFKTSQSKMLKVVDKMLSDLKVKLKVLLEIQLTLFQKREKKLFLMNILILILFLLFLLKRFSVMIFQKLKDLLETQNPCLLQKNWYSKPTPPDMQFEERVFQTQFSVSTDKL